MIYLLLKCQIYRRMKFVIIFHILQEITFEYQYEGIIRCNKNHLRIKSQKFTFSLT